MNLKIHEVISSLTGVSGLAMVRAIVGGERDAEILLALCDVQIRRAKAERMRALWRIACQSGAGAKNRLEA